MSTATIDRTVARKGVLAELAGQLKAGNLTQEESAALLAEWDRNNPAPNGNAASAAKPANGNGVKATLMKSPDQEKARQEILKLVGTGKMTVQDASKELDKLDKAASGRLYLKVSEKGAASLYGLQRLPVTLYVEQWERLLAFAPGIADFMVEHDADLKRKPAKA